jgi:hypothetical protein
LLLNPANWTAATVYSAFESIVSLVVMPAAAPAAATLAIRNRRLGLATGLLCLPTLYVLAVMAAFAIGISVRGF